MVPENIQTFSSTGLPLAESARTTPFDDLETVVALHQPRVFRFLLVHPTRPRRRRNPYPGDLSPRLDRPRQLPRRLLRRHLAHPHRPQPRPRPHPHRPLPLLEARLRQRRRCSRCRLQRSQPRRLRRITPYRSGAGHRSSGRPSPASPSASAPSSSSASLKRWRSPRSPTPPACLSAPSRATFTAPSTSVRARHNTSQKERA